MIKRLNRAGMDWTDQAVRLLKGGLVKRQPGSPEPGKSHFRAALIGRACLVYHLQRIWPRRPAARP
jgi:hypothetical protein